MSKTVDMCTKLEKMLSESEVDLWLASLSTEELDWLGKLKESLRFRPGCAREVMLETTFPKLHGYLDAWRKEREQLELMSGKRQPPSFTGSARKCFELMVREKRAPTQASGNKQEVALAKWLSRYSKASIREKLIVGSARWEIVSELALIADGLRSSDADVVMKNIKRLQPGDRSKVLQQLLDGPGDGDRSLDVVWGVVDLKPANRDAVTVGSRSDDQKRSEAVLELHQR